MHMLYNKDPVMPFEVANKLKDCDELSSIPSSSSFIDQTIDVTSPMNGELIDTVQQLEEQRHEIFGSAKQNTQKSQEHQAKGYNNRQNKGKPFDVSTKVLKYDFHQMEKLNKLKSHYLGLYTIHSHSSTGSSYHLIHRHNHSLKKPVPASHLVCFYDNKGSHSKETDDCIYDEISSSSNMEYYSDEKSNCKRAKVYEPNESSTPFTSTPIKLQIIIMSSKEMPPSSDESEMIDVGTNDLQNVFGDINVDKIPIEIIDDFMNSTEYDSNDTIILTGVKQSVDLYFNPLNDENRHLAALKLSLVLTGKTHPVHTKGVGTKLKIPPTVTIKACGNGACLFNSFALLLCERDTYSAIICHVICNYIKNPVKHRVLKQFIPNLYATGKEYTVRTMTGNFTTWGTELEIIAFTQLTGFNVFVFTQQKSWARYSHDPINSSSSERAFYLTNESGSHFDLIFNVTM